MDRTEVILIRNYVPDDKKFILQTWTKGLRFGNDWFNFIDEQHYKTYQGVLDYLVDHCAHTTRVCCLKEDPDIILGYCVCEPKIVHWCFVKTAWRGIGIARGLWPEDEAVEVVTHITKAGKSIVVRKMPDLRFEPFITD